VIKFLFDKKPEDLMTEQNLSEENKNAPIPEVIPLLPLHNVLLFPKMMIPLEVTGANSVQLVG
jgi:ATP-dependent Lon protease